MTQLPTRIELESEDMQTLHKLNDKQQAVLSFVETVSKQGEQRVATLQAETREFWKKAAETYGLDIDHVNYTLSNDGKAIIPMGMRFDPS